MNNSIKFLVEEKDDSKRLDVFLSKKIDHLTRSNIKKIIESNNVKINKKITNSSSKKVRLNDSIIIELIIKNSNKLLPNKIELDIHFEDKLYYRGNHDPGQVLRNCVHPKLGKQILECYIGLNK